MKRQKESPLCHVDGHVSSQKCGAGTKFMVPAKARPLNLVARSPWSEKDSSPILGYLVNPGNAEERKGVEIASGNSLQTASKSEI